MKVVKKKITNKISEILPVSNKTLSSKIDLLYVAMNDLVKAQTMQDRLIEGIQQALRDFDNRKAGTTKTIVRIKRLSLYTE